MGTLTDNNFLTGSKVSDPFVKAAKSSQLYLREQPNFGLPPYPGRASGYIVDTMQTVPHHFFITDSFESLVVETMNCGEDADTTGAIAGMLGGALYGAGAIPARWLGKLNPQVVSEIKQQVRELLRLAECVSTQNYP